jgi:hypothetical protein
MHSDFRKYCLALKRFVSLLGDTTQDEFWKPFLFFFKTYRFEMCAAPLPFNHPLNQTEKELYEALKAKLAMCKEIYPEHEERTNTLLEWYLELKKTDENPLLDNTVKLCNTDKHCHNNTGLLIKEPYLVPEVEEVVGQNPLLRDIEIVVPELLKGSKSYRMLIIFGPPRWFPEFIFTSPRARDIHIFNYNWIMGDWKIQPPFIESEGIKPVASELLAKNQSEERIERLEEFINAEELMPLNIEDIIKRITQKPTTEREVEEVDARLYEIEGGFVFLEATPDAKSLVINLEDYSEDEGKESSCIERIPTSDIEPGMFVLLRTRGGGDYIQPIADRIIGEKATSYRDAQRRWKNRLRDATRKGLFETCIELLDFGSIIANEANVRRWMSERSIKPQTYKDFNAIMQLIGMSNEATEFWKIAHVIDRAHRKAGFHIRKLLLKQVMKSDLKLLEKMGKLDFELPEDDGGSLSVFRVKRVVQETYKIKESQLGHLFKGGELWHE